MPADESVRGDEVFFIQTLRAKNVNDLVMETWIAADAARELAKNFTAVPHYAYARQDRKAAAREPITARLMAKFTEEAGVDRVITLDLHQGQIQGFDVPVSPYGAVSFWATTSKKSRLTGKTPSLSLPIWVARRRLKSFPITLTAVLPSPTRAVSSQRVSRHGYHRRHHR